MKPEEGGAFSVGSTTLDVDNNGSLFTDPDEGPATVVIIEDVVTTPTTGAKEATQTVGIFGTKVTDTL